MGGSMNSCDDASMFNKLNDAHFMLDRRQLMWGAAGACAALATPGFANQPSAGLDALSWSNFDGRAVRHLARADRIAIPTYRFGLVVRSGISATATNVNVQTSVDLVGVSLEMARAIADRAMANFMQVAAATGRPIVPMEEIRASQGYAQLRQAPIPWGKSPFADARHAVFVAPNGHDLFFTHFEAPMTDQSPVSLGNWRALNRISVDTRAVIVMPTVVIDFAQLSGSGHRVYGGASTSVQPGLYVVDVLTYLSVYHARIAIAGDLGRASLQRRAPIGQAGEFVQTSDVNNRGEVAWWNADVARGAATPGTGPSRAFSYGAYEYRIDPPLFMQACLDGIGAVNRAFGEGLAANPPR